MTKARILDASRFSGGIMLHFDHIPDSKTSNIRIGDTIYKAIPCSDLGARFAISSPYPTDYFSRNNIAEFLDT